MYKIESKEDLEEKANQIDPSLSSKFYIPNFSSFLNRHIIKTRIDPQSKFRITPTPRYLLPRGVLGLCDHYSNEIQNDQTQSDSEYTNTENHELIHAIFGYDEVTTRIVNGDDHMQY